MLGAILLVVAVVILLPMSFLMLGGMVASVFSYLATATAKADHPDRVDA